MNRAKGVLLGIMFLLLIAVSWYIGVTSETDAERQIKLIDQATALMDDEIYIKAVPLLEEAASYDEELTLEAEEKLKTSYLNLLSTRGITRKYTELLDKQMDREDATEEVFLEAANYYLERDKLKNAFEILRNGIKKTESEKLVQLYESKRYGYRINRNIFQYASELYEGYSKVKRDEGWGLAEADGSLVVPCSYDAISTYSNGQCFVKQESTVSAVDLNNNRVALCHEDVTDFSNFAQNRAWMQTPEGWRLSDSNFNLGSIRLEDVGMFANGAAAAKVNGHWGLINLSGSEWILEPDYDDIITDELGRAYSQSAVFVKKGYQILLLVRNEKTGEFNQVGDDYEDAHPFADGYAAVKKDGKWGYIDVNGKLQVNYSFEDALSFGQHLAAVKIGELWGYISLYGELVIEPQFADVKSFESGHTVVLTERGWQFITLLEYEEGSGL